MDNRQQIREHYFSMIATWQQSGQSQKKFCLQNDIAYHVFHYWYKVFRNHSADNRGSFVEVSISPKHQPNVEMHLTGGRRIVFHQPVSADFLKALIA